MTSAMLHDPIRLASHALFALALLACGDDAVPGPSVPPDAQPETPPASAGHDLVYDDALGTVLLVNAGLGGPDDARMMGQSTRVWSWDGTRWSLLDSSGPPVRNLGGVVYDSRRDKLVLHGGTFSASLSYSDTWEWDRSGGWHRFDVPGPGTREHTQMAYDPERGVAVLFGGQATLTSFPADTWEWDGTSWAQVATAGPPPRVHHAMSFDPFGHRVLVFGGSESGMRDLSDTWAWDGRAWTQLAGSSTLGRTHARLAQHEARGAHFLIGGMDAQGTVDDYLRFDGSKWHTAVPLQGPVPRYLPGLAHDRVRQVLVLFGGGGANDALLSDVWEFDGNNWRRSP
jgi:hypothetical protein